jgi:pimeloyl-[acyl-carrier protein] methyl ester esterase
MNINLVSYGEGTPVVFFHGWGFDHHVWLPLIPELGRQYQLILVDLPGFGLTSMMDWSSFKTQLLNQLPQQFAVAGWSLGGLFAQRLAIETSERIRSLMIIASSPCFMADHSWPALSKDVFTHFYNKLSQDVEATLNDFINLQLNKAKVPINIGKMPSQEALEAGLKILEEWDFRHPLSQLSKSTCFIFGRLDPIAPVKIMQKMQMLYPQFHYVLFKHSAHMPFLSHMDLFIDEFKRFIK